MEKENWKLCKNNSMDLWKYDLILAIQKSLVRIWLQFLKEEFHIKIYYFMFHNILSHYMKFLLKFNINF
jgi:hypothetical protein